MRPDNLITVAQLKNIDKNNVVAYIKSLKCPIVGPLTLKIETSKIKQPTSITHLGIQNTN